ncbi:aminotransferase [Taklimakanibacter albus]|uniref:Aminotransferase n=1 Tax=Taklimakanibacter albus TaxID=2800327 RepID=A0ACC5QYE0_9HYPH|nr:aminotransferase [Aestuariivirga sp. YIM B02566]MBK1865383.1 aminotransferase [Aestuariivirga sp. YIM B02566]
MTLTTNFEKSAQEAWEQDRAHLIHPFSSLAANKEEGCTVMAGSDGVHVMDAEGNRFYDGIGGLWCVNVGYGREEIIEAIVKQLRELPFYSAFNNLTNKPASALAAKLAELAPGKLNHVFFGTGGSVANDSAVRLVHHYFNRIGKPYRKKILSRQNAYHGSTHLTIALTGPVYQAGWDGATDLVHYLSAPHSYRRPAGVSEEGFLDFLIQEMEDAILKLGPDNVAAFIAEPIMGAGGVIVPPEGYHKRTFDLCRKYGIFYISDEVVTAFGRLGHMFASFDKFGIEPDIIASAKGISSGYQPLSATIISDEIFEVISRPGAAFFHGFTYSCHPAACAAGLKNIEIIEREKICERVRKTGPIFEKTLHKLEDLDLVGEVRGSHFMMCIESVADKKTKALLPAEANVGKRIAQNCQKRGLIVRPLGQLNILSPPLTLEVAQIEEIGAILRQSIKATMDDLKKDGFL